MRVKIVNTDRKHCFIAITLSVRCVKCSIAEICGHSVQ